MQDQTVYRKVKQIKIKKRSPSLSKRTNKPNKSNNTSGLKKPLRRRRTNMVQTQRSRNSSSNITPNPVAPSEVKVMIPEQELKATSYDVFRFPVIDWNYRWQRPQQIAVQFAKDGYRVFYFTVDMHPIPDEKAIYEDICKQVQIKPLQDSVWQVTLCSHRPLNAYRDGIEHPLDIKYLSWSIQYIKQKFNSHSTLSIIDLPFWTPLVMSMENNRIIYDCMDEHSGFSNNGPSLFSQEPIIMERADLVMTSSQYLYDKVKKYNPASCLIRNGGEFEHFSRASDEMEVRNETYPHPVIGYYGAIADWFDFKVIEFLADRHPEWTFILVGHNYRLDSQKIESLSNVHFTGEKPYNELPGYLQKFDVCLIPFCVNELTLATNPVKAYEYLAGGKPVVSTRLPELELMQDMVYLAESPEQFEAAIQTALEENNEELISKRKAYAANHTWKKRYEEIQNQIKQFLYPKVSIIIVTYNNWSYTRKCLDSIMQNSYYPNMEIILVDNASIDETRDKLANMRASCQTKVLFCPRNAGFANANNLGMRIADGDYYILLNNDTIVTPGWIEKLIKPLHENPDFGLAGPVSNNVGNDQRLDFVANNERNGCDPDWYHFYSKINKGKFRETDMLGFYCVAIKKKALELTGPLDSRYRVGMFEDDDYCQRAAQQGFKLMIVEDAFVYHYGSVSFKQLKVEKYQKLFKENKRRYEEKWGKWQEHKPPITLFEGADTLEKVTERVHQIGKPLVLVHAGLLWTKGETNFLERAMANHPDAIIIVFAHQFFGENVHGIRRIVENMYATHRLDLFQNVSFNEIIHYGTSYAPI